MTIDLTDRYAIALQRIIEGIDTKEDRGLAPFHAKKMQERVAAVRTAHLQELRGETEEEALVESYRQTLVTRNAELSRLQSRGHDLVGAILAMAAPVSRAVTQTLDAFKAELGFLRESDR